MEFMNGNHAVSRSNRPFAQVWTDMALEQSINRDSKTKGGIVGISQKPGALRRWFVTSHERAAITRCLREMCGIGDSERVGTHKEARLGRVQRDEEDIQKLLSVFDSGMMSNPFTLGHDDESHTRLLNIATGVVAPGEVSGQLHHWKRPNGVFCCTTQYE